ncbi:copper-binding protein [Variovorax sp. PBL-E5]|uniref:copper-binding protein n=1 Tax=Variovorax sp. PBL-E5 TaxID=434014 RepID=UPI0013191E73|nr:copper-binding protein [Variovorax sp. PBL-E5]VTU39091.1 hypothetical protein E5CHR_04992 [Variovorax sp. PBL-E5]
MSMALHPWALAGMSLLLMSVASAQPTERRPVEPAHEAAPVFTRARFTSTHEEADGRLYVRLKLLPRSKIPFTTQTFRVADRALLAGIPEGAWVEFTSRHVEGENRVTAIRAVAECRRFQTC